MNSDHSPMNQVDACVVRICGQGCAMVYRTIARMEAGGEFAAVDNATRMAVLAE